MKFTSLSIAAVALASITSANAADLGRPAPVAVDYVKVCDAYGAGYFYIPGGSTCLKIGGHVQGVYTSYNDNWNAARTAKASEFSSRARLQLDARSSTEAGQLRGFFSADFKNSGFGLDKAYLQWGGLTAGYATSMFDFYTGSAYGQVWGQETSDVTTNLLAYTFAFGNGVSATLSIEDALGRRSATGGVDGYGHSLTASDANGAIYISVANTSVLQLAATGAYGGSRVPDVVANINVTQAWGAAQVMAAYHETYGMYHSGDAGYAVGAGVKVNVPMFGAGDSVSLQAAWAHGAAKYTSANNHNDFLDVTPSTAGLVQGANLVGGAAGPISGITLANSWSVVGGFAHNFNSQIELDFDIGYSHNDGAVVTVAGPFSVGTAATNTTTVRGSLGYTPVKNLTIWLDAGWQQVAKDAVVNTALSGSPVASSAASTTSSSNVSLIVRRSF